MHSTPSRLLVATSLAVAVLGATACAPTMGQSNELGFAYGADDAIAFVSVRRPLAVGCRGEIVVYASDAEQTSPDIVWGDEVMREASPVAVTAARSANPDIIEVVDTDGARVVLRGVSAGTSQLYVEAKTGKDVIEVEVAESARIELSHLAWDSERAAPDHTVLLHGGTVHFSVTRHDKQGRALACFDPGRGIDIEPADDVRIVSSPRDIHHLRLALDADSPSAISITPLGGQERTVSTTPPEAVDRVSIEFVRSRGATGPVAIEPGQTQVFRVHVGTATGGYALALDGVLDVTSQTPQVCEVASLSHVASDGLYAVRGVQPGTCTLEASISGNTASDEFEVSAPAR